ncbi:MAG TPA: hypothetical protein VMM92_02450 [Thermoanaerobaculia bacterium]|nr:hypothetical protein [Thermoanaerobaculia bacterium]
MNRCIRPALIGMALALSLGAALQAQLPSSPRRFVDFLDERCYQISGPAISTPLRLDHLNPVLLGMGLGPQNVTLSGSQSLCVPVAKNGSVAPADTLPFIQYVDWKCYGVTGTAPNVPLHLTHLNTVFAGLFGANVDVTLLEPQQLCVPVSKNNANIPANVLALIQYLDVECFRVSSTQNLTRTITLQHLNPLLTTLSRENSSVGPTPVQLCVPVTKNQTVIPTTIQQYIAFSDVLCYPATGNPLGLNLQLKHLNPVLAGLPVETLFVGNSQKLCVPVAKNNMLPPGNP